jgi:lipopolysaccharide biosynthesis glycosyltransferase
MEDKIAALGNIDLHWHVIDRNAFTDLPVLRRINSTMYMRLLMDDILPIDMPRIIYVDGDVLIEGDLAELYQVDMGDAMLGAVCDFGGTYIREELPLPGIDPETKKKSPYFNSGVLLINMKPWREQKIGRAVIDYVKQNKSIVRFPDQDGLNAVLFGKWKHLDLSWNAQTDELINPANLGEQPLDQEIRRRRDELLFHPKIQHYAGRKKPWDPGRFRPVRARFVHYLHASRWLQPAQLMKFHVTWIISTAQMALGKLLPRQAS